MQLRRSELPREKERVKLDFAKFPPCVAIVGSRSFTDNKGTDTLMAATVSRFVYKLPKTVEIVSGGAEGVDDYAEKAAKRYRRPFKVFEPSEEIVSPQRFFARNRQIVDYVKEHNGIVVAFADNEKMRGTTYTLNYAKKQGVPTLVYRFGRFPLRTVGVDIDGCDEVILGG